MTRICGRFLGRRSRFSIEIPHDTPSCIAESYRGPCVSHVFPGSPGVFTVSKDGSAPSHSNFSRRLQGSKLHTVSEDGSAPLGHDSVNTSTRCDGRCISRVAPRHLRSSLGRCGRMSVPAGRCGAPAAALRRAVVGPGADHASGVAKSLSTPNSTHSTTSLYFLKHKNNLSTSIQLLPDTSRPCSRLSRALRRVRSGAGAAQEGEQAQVAMKLLAQGAPAAALGCVQCPQRRQQLRCGSEGLLMHA